MATAMATGTLTMPDGLTYTGQWKDGQIDGTGTLTQPNGDIYEGDLVAGQRQGTGKVTYATGDIYEGSFCGKTAARDKAHSPAPMAMSTQALGLRERSRGWAR